MSSILELPNPVELVALRLAFPTYKINIILLGDRRRYEAVSRDFGDPYCLISISAKELWRELVKSVKPAVTGREDAPCIPLAH